MACNYVFAIGFLAGRSNQNPDLPVAIQGDWVRVWLFAPGLGVPGLLGGYLGVPTRWVW